MPKSIEKHVAPDAVARRLTQWAEQVTDAWIAERRGTPEDISRKPFTREQLVGLAVFAAQADDIRAHEVVAHGNTLPGPDTWSPGPHFWNLIRALYCEFGYVVGFLAFVREEWAKDRGRTVKHGVRALWPDKRTKRPKATARVVKQLLMSPAFADWLREHGERRGVALGMKDARELIERLGYTVEPTALKEATRKA